MDHRRQTIRMLALEDSPNDVERWVKLLRAAGMPPRIQHIPSIDTMEIALQEHEWDLVLSAEKTSRVNAKQVLSIIKKHKRDLPVIITLPEYSPEKITTWVAAGAKDAIPGNHEQHILHAILREIHSLDDRRKLEETLHSLEESNKRCKLLLANASEAIAYIHDGMHVDANTAYLELTGYTTPDDLAGITLIDLIDKDHQRDIKALLKKFNRTNNSESIECQLAHVDGHYTPVILKLSEAQYDDEPCIQLTLLPLIPVLNQPIETQSTTKTAEASSTPATVVVDTLDSSEQFQKKANTILNSTKQATLVYIQLDEFESLKKDHSEAGIASVQQSMAKLIKKPFPKAIGCQQSENTFLLIDTEHTPEAIEDLLINLLNTIEHHLFGSADETITVTATIGFAPTTAGVGFTSLLAHAEKAHEMAIEQKEPAPKVIAYSKESYTKWKAHKGDILSIIVDALSKDGFQLLFQPVVSVIGTDEQQYEVLLRLPTPQGGIVEANDFITTAEANHLMPHIDRWVLRQCTRRMSSMNQQGKEVTLLIHISHQSIQENDIAQFLAGILKVTKIPAERIILQLPETIVLQQLKRVVKFSEAISAIGCKLSITRFQGDSKSMNILKHLNVQFVRMDGSFIEKLDDDGDEEVHKMLTPLKEQNIHCIVSKVENSKTLAHLWRLGVDYAQGYYIQGPTDTMDFEFN